MPTVIAINVAARIDVRIGDGTSSENANGAFDFSMTVSLSECWYDAYSGGTMISGGSLSSGRGITLPKMQGPPQRWVRESSFPRRNLAIWMR